MIRPRIPRKLSEYFEKHADARVSEDKVLDSILLVGGRVHNDWLPDKLLAFTDSMYLRNIVQVVKAQSYSLSANPDIQIANIYYDEDDNFLTLPPKVKKAKLVVFGFVFYDPEMPGLVADKTGNTVVPDWDCVRGALIQSRLAFEPDRWPQALADTGADMAINITEPSTERQNCLPTKMLVGDAYELAATHRAMEVPALSNDTDSMGYRQYGPRDYHVLTRRKAAAIVSRVA